MPCAADRSEGGFTLVELLVVILIIGVLAAIAVPVFLNQRKVAADAALKSDMRSVAQAIETWQVKTGKTAAQMESGQNAWTMVLRHSPETRTLAAVSANSEFHPEGFVPPKLSDGVAISVTTERWLHGNKEDGYCVVGTVEGGSYTPSLTHTKRQRALYFDSISGGMMTASELTDKGACAYHFRNMGNSND